MNQFGAGQRQPASDSTLFPGFPALDIARLVAVTRKRLWLAAVIALAVIGVVVAYVFLAPKVYESTAVVYVDPPNEMCIRGFAEVKSYNRAISFHSCKSETSVANCMDVAFQSLSDGTGVAAV